MHIFNFIAAVLFIIMPVQDNGWKLEKDKSGIKIYTRVITGSSFKAFKGVTVIADATVPQVMDIIFDVNNYDRLFPDCSHQKILKYFSKYHNIQYLRIHAPWPVSDRDNVTELEAHFSKDSTSAEVSIKLLPDYLDVEKGLVRIREGEGFWKLKQQPGGGVEVIYQYHSNPGGSIPSWLANSFVVKHPFKTLENLKARVEKAKRKNQRSKAN